MAQPKARLYQRLRTKGFPWVLVQFHKNGSPRPQANAFQFGVRYLVKGKRKLDTAAMPDEALAILKDRRVRLYAQHNGVVLQEEAGKRSASGTKIFGRYNGVPDNWKGTREKMERGHAPLLPRFDWPVLEILRGRRYRKHSGHRQKSRA